MSTSPGLDAVAGDEPVALGHADGEADEVELARLHRARVLGHLAADQRAPGLAAARRPRPRPAARCGRGRACPRRCSRGRTAARRPGTRGRRRTWPRGRCRWCRTGRRPGPPAPWCRRRRSSDTSTGWRVAVVGEGEQPAEAADVADHLGPEGGADLGLDALDGLLAGGDADTRVLVRLARQVRASSAEQLVVERSRAAASRRQRRVVDRGRHRLAAARARPCAASTGTATG